MACFDMMKFCPYCGGQFSEVISNSREKVVCGACGCTWMNNEERIAALEAQVREREAECERQIKRAERAEGELAGSDVNVRELWSRVTAAEAALAASRESCDFYKRRVDLLQSKQTIMRDPERTLVCDILANGAVLPDPDGKRYGLAALRSRADEAGRVERVAKWMRKDAFGFSDPDVDLDKEWVELEEGEREAWRRDARAVLAAADGREL